MLFELLWEIRQERKIGAADATASAAKRRAKTLADELTDLRRRQARLMLVCQALWELLGERLGLTDEQLLEKVREIDRRDGREDGRIGASQLTCPNCGRNATSARTHCLYCGAPLRRPHLFE